MILDTRYLSNDIKAGITVFLVAIPLCLGIALASGTPILSGLIAGIVGGIIVGKLSGSRLSVSGPAAGLVAIILAATNDLGSYNMVLTSLALAGGIQIIFGYIGAGIIAHYIPHSVVKGMLAAIGLILIFKQIPHSVGYNKVLQGNLSFAQNDGQNTFSEMFNILGHISYSAIIISALSFFLLYLFSRKSFQTNKILKYIPASLIVITTGAICNLLINKFLPSIALTSESLVQIPNLFINGGLKAAMISPDISALSNMMTYKYAFILAAVASIETLLCIEATDKLDPQRGVTSTSRELKAQGVGNLICGFLGGLPVTSVIVRSSVNIESNAKTKTSTIIHGLLLVVSIFLARPLINLIPLASLSCILIVIGYKLTSEKLIKDMFKKGPDQFIPFVITIVSILLTDLLTGVFVGLIVAMFLILKNYYKMQRFDLLQEAEINDVKSQRILFSEYITFLNKANIEKILSTVPQNSIINLDFHATKMIDNEVKDIFEDFKTASQEKNINIITHGNTHNHLRLCFSEKKQIDEVITIDKKPSTYKQKKNKQSDRTIQ